MGEKENQRLIEEISQAINAKDFDKVRAAYHPDATQEWPQSGERLVGVDNIMAVNENYEQSGNPYPTESDVKVRAAGDLVVAESRLDYGGKLYNLVSVFEMRDGKVFRETDYFSEPFDPPDWRSQWVETI